MGNSSKQTEKIHYHVNIFSSSMHALNFFSMNRSNNNVSSSIVDLYMSLYYFKISGCFIMILIFSPYKTGTLLTCNSQQRSVFSLVDRNFVDSWDSTVLGELLCPCSDGKLNCQILHPLWKSCSYICMAEHAVLNSYKPQIN